MFEFVFERERRIAVSWKKKYLHEDLKVSKISDYRYEKTIYIYI